MEDNFEIISFRKYDDDEAEDGGRADQLNQASELANDILGLR